MKYVLTISIFIVGLVLGTIGMALFDRSNDAVVTEQKQSNYPLLAKRIFVEDPNDTLINFSTLRTQIRSRLGNTGHDLSFYFEYLPTGTAIRVEGENQLVAASLIKLPLVMNLYHADELDRLDLNTVVELAPTDLDPSFGDLYQRGAGTSLTLKELAEIALTKSDNTAAKAIGRTIEGKLTLEEESLMGLDIDYDLEEGQGVFSARSYSSILKCLYFSCYLTNDHSQELLGYLTKSSFNNRLTQSIPSEVKVAHKIGVYNPQNVHSDCGIFYIPKRTYIVCILIQGKEGEVNTIMSETSKDIYNWVTSQK